MLMKERRSKGLTAVLMIAPFVITYLTVFAYPVYNMFALSFTDAPLIGEGRWVGFDNYAKLLNQKLFFTSVWNTGYFVVLTVVPNTLIGLGLALMVIRLKGWLQSLVLVLFFLPYILPVSVVTQIWEWVLDQQFGIAQYLIEFFTGRRISVFRDPILGDADGGAGHNLVDQRFQPAALHCRFAQHSGGLLRGGNARRRDALAMLPAYHLAADLARYRPRAHATAHPAAQDLRSGLPDDGRRSVQLDLCTAATRLSRGIPPEPWRSRFGGGGLPVPDHRHRFGAAVSASAR
ncbi:hypothetical protein ABIE78_004410 [Sinorhizobium fredii]